MSFKIIDIRKRKRSWWSLNIDNLEVEVEFEDGKRKKTTIYHIIGNPKLLEEYIQRKICKGTQWNGTCFVFPSIEFIIEKTKHLIGKKISCDS